MPTTTLMDTIALAQQISDPALVIVDCRFKLDDTSWGEQEYARHHIPGAVYAHLDRDLSGAKNGTNGRHPLPDVDALARTFGRLGITSGVQVVAYDQDTGSYASRLWWLLRWLGHDAVAVLDGGFAKWTAELRETTSGVESRAAVAFDPLPRPEMSLNLDQVETVVGTRGWRLLDARAPERFRGETEPIDRVPGHIPGAANYFYQTNLDDTGIFRPAEEVRARLHDAIGDVPADHVVCYCGSGVTACHNLLAFEHAGLQGAKLYAGSWSEWSSDPLRPIARHDKE